MRYFWKKFQATACALFLLQASLLAGQAASKYMLNNRVGEGVNHLGKKLVGKAAVNEKGEAWLYVKNDENDIIHIKYIGNLSASSGREREQIANEFFNQHIINFKKYSWVRKQITKISKRKNLN